jgi:cobalt transporter subunit CbtB
MAAITHTAPRAPSIHIPWWTWFVLVVALFGSYLMLQENGILLSQWETVHEFFHDGRHSLGFPCH